MMCSYPLIPTALLSVFLISTLQAHRGQQPQNPAETEQFLTSFVMLALLQMFEGFAEYFSWVPGYSLAKVMLILAIIVPNPQTKKFLFEDRMAKWILAAEASVYAKANKLRAYLASYISHTVAIIVRWALVDSPAVVQALPEEKLAELEAVISATSTLIKTENTRRLRESLQSVVTKNPDAFHSGKKVTVQSIAPGGVDTGSNNSNNTNGSIFAVAAAEASIASPASPFCASPVATYSDDAVAAPTTRRTIVTKRAAAAAAAAAAPSSTISTTTAAAVASVTMKPSSASSVSIAATIKKEAMSAVFDVAEEDSENIDENNNNAFNNGNIPPPSLENEDDAMIGFRPIKPIVSQQPVSLKSGISASTVGTRNRVRNVRASIL